MGTGSHDGMDMQETHCNHCDGTGIDYR
jgi:hypothetical protein